MITLYADGAARGNPGKGGYGIVLLYKNYRKELTAGFRRTTNNRMELLGVIVGLEAIKTIKRTIHIYVDSKYIVDSVTKGWLHSWIKKKFKGIKNQDLWERFWHVYQQHDVHFFWVKGHAGNKENERCDYLATQSAQAPHLFIDTVYEQNMCT